MKNIVIFLFTILACFHDVMGQVRVIKGRVVNEELSLSPGVNIWTKDSVLLGKTDSEGKFSVIASQKDLKIRFSGIGMEPATVNLSDNCESIEIVMLNAWHFDFMSLAKMNRHRLRKFERIDELHTEAFLRGVFNKSTVCYSRVFEPWKMNERQ